MAETATTTTPTETPPEVKPPKENTNPKEPEASEENMTEKNKVAGMKKYVGMLSLFTTILSLPILASVIWLLYMKDYDCEKLLKLPNLQIGIVVGLIFVFLISNIVVFLRSKAPVIGFFAVMVPLMVLLTIGLALVGGYKLESPRILATPMWFKEKVQDDDNWQNIKSCLYGTHTCDDLAIRSLTLTSYDFSLIRLTSIESGCCKPPDICGMDYVNATFWKKGGNSLVDEWHPYIRDCDTWSNKEKSLCYDCDSCRHGFATIMESKWWRLGVFLIFMSLLLIVSHLLLFIAVMLERYNG